MNSNRVMFFIFKVIAAVLGTGFVLIVMYIINRLIA